MSTQTDTTQKKIPQRSRPKTITGRQFKKVLKELGLTVASKRTSALIGVSVRQVQRLASGMQPVPRPIELLLQQYKKHGIDDDG
jgi:hypothetical protein